MNLQNIAIRSPGDLNKERLVMRALTDLDVGAYTIFAVVGREGVPTNDLRHAFWFPDLSVKKNDLVVVYTKVGKHKKKLK
ncbi:MAG: hypothetical protein U5L06_06415 [Rhodovibrio sp.]|nr:hypothetical protein [Rhodovibrio sp.]